MSNFEEEVFARMKRLNRVQSEFFSWLCIVRVLPFFSPIDIIYEGSKLKSDEALSKLQKHLFSIFWAIDLIAYNAGLYYRTNNECDIASRTIISMKGVEKYMGYNKTTICIIHLITMAVRNTNLYAGNSVKAYSDIALQTYSIANMASTSGNLFKKIILSDIDTIERRFLNKLECDVSIYGSAWDTFHNGLRKLDCSYWSELYKDLFESEFDLSKEELKRRLGTPDEIKNKGAAVVGQFLRRLGSNVGRLNEVRIIILGEKGVGKTSIARRLIDCNAPMPRESESTEGVQTSFWVFPDEKGNNMCAHIWDFAGHSITHSAHRCFMSARCLYIYVYNGRIERDNNPVYWMEQIRIHGGENSSILFLINERDGHKADIPERTLKRQYPSIIDYYRVDIGNDDTTKLEYFRQIAMRIAINNPSWNNQIISRASYKIKNHLRKLFEKEKPPYITRDTFDEIARKCGATENHITGILEDLHTLGICFWYSEENLEEFNMLVLNPDWITNAIYKIINKGFESDKCILTVSDGVNILKDDERYVYPHHKVMFLFKLMKVYELAFFKSAKLIFIPGILPIDEPDGLPVFNDPSDRLKMCFVVDRALPPNISSRVIVHRSEFGEIFNEKLLWRKGAVLKSNIYDATALVVESERSITICIYGKGKSEYSADLRKTLQTIFESYITLYPNLYYEILEPTISQTTDTVDSLLITEPPMVAECVAIDCLRENRPYRDVDNGRYIALNKTAEGYKIMFVKKISFLFVTANKYEKLAFEKKFKKEGINYVKGIPYLYGEFGNYIVAWFHMPSQGTSNSDSTILCGEVIKEVAPIAVVMVGIAFGADEREQKIGDVLVSKVILNYDSRKERNGSTQYKETPKEVGFQLFNAFNSFSYGISSWEYPMKASDSEKFKVISGAILTGSALVDDYNFRKKLLTDFSDYAPIGGEMEAYGIYSQCRFSGVSEWIIVKSICDWGYNKQDVRKDEWQNIAADSAVDFCHSVFTSRGGNGKGIFDDLINLL